MATIYIATINVNGMRNAFKRKALFRCLKKKRYDVVCLQETFVTEKDIELWEKEWGGKLFCFPASNRSKGQITLIRKHFPHQVLPLHSSERILTVGIKTDSMHINIVNAYAPNVSQEKRTFYGELVTHIETLLGENIVCGDFNCVLSNDLDVVSGHPHAVNDIQCFHDMVLNCELNDVWRLYHPEEKVYTWSRKSPFTARRLDYLFTTDAIFDKSLACDIVSMPLSDHRLTEFKFKTTAIKRGPSYWKFNDSLLQDADFICGVNSLINNFVTENDNLDAQTKWDLCKIKIREFCIAFSIDKKRKKTNSFNDLQTQLNATEKLLSVKPDDNELLNQKDDLKRKLEIHAYEESRSAQIRSRIKFIEEGEKNTKYFLNMERARGNGKIMDRLKTPLGETLTLQEDIMKEQVRFYKEVYDKKRNFDVTKAEDFMTDTSVPTLSDEQKQSLEVPISVIEIAEALKSMKNGSAPGPDGLTYSFLKMFWCQINTLIFESFNAAHRQGEMSITQRQAVITLIHKGKELPRDELANWRPISLTNTDYKLLAKCLAFRISNIIPHIIDNNQVGFMKGRNISTMIRLIDDTLESMNLLNKPGILLAVDFQRAFDSISKDFIFWSFRRFGFGDNFVRWVQVLMANTESKINYLGWLSEGFDVKSGIRQGCPFSPLAFIIALEMMALKIRNDPMIKGLKLPIANNVVSINTLLKILLYADDVTIFVQDRHELERAIELIDKFSEFSNLKINKNKTEAMWLGSKKKSDETYLGLKWNTKVKIVGIFFSNTTPASLLEDNWTSRLEKVQTLIASWTKRNLSISGKLCIIKSFLLSQFVYVLQSLALPEHVLKKLNTFLFRFLWKKKNTNTRAFEKVKRTVVCNDIEKGGLKMIDVHTMQSSFLISWAINLLQSSNEIWSVIPKYIFDSLGLNLSCFMSDVTPQKFVGFNYLKSYFWKQVLTTWLSNMHKLGNENDPTFLSVNHNCLWNNSKIMYRNKSLFYKDWIDANICFISDAVNDGNIISFNDVCERVGQKPTRQFEYNALCTALRGRLAEPLITSTSMEQTNVLKVCKRVTPQIIRHLLTTFKTEQPCCQKFWVRKYGITLTDAHWAIAYKTTKEERLRLLHWKLLHNIYPTNIMLHKMGLRDSIRCSYCQENDFIEHFFWSCPKIKKIWSLCSEYIFKATYRQIVLSETDVLFGYDIQDTNSSFCKLVNRVILICKMVISKFRYGKAYDVTVLFEREIELRQKSLFLNT